MSRSRACGGSLTGVLAGPAARARRDRRLHRVAGTLIARDLHKAHGAATILAGVSVTVAPGDVLGVVGPNGAGKSTLLRILAGLDRPDRGSVRLTAGHGRLPAAGARPRSRRAAAPSTSRGAPASRTPMRACRPPRTSWRRTRPAPRTATPTRSRRGSRSVAPISSSARRRSCATSGWIPRCSTWRPWRFPAARPRARRWRRSCSRRFDVLLLDEPTNDLDFDGLARLERFVAERPGRRRDRLPRPRLPRAHGHARARARRGRAHRVGVRRRLGRLPRAARDRRPPRRGALRDVRGGARPPDRPRRPSAPVVGDRRAPRQGLGRHRSRQDRPCQTGRALREAGGEGPRDREGHRSAREGRRSRGGAGSCSCASAAASAPAT